MSRNLPIEQARSNGLRGSVAAIARAAKRAREVAMQTQTAVVLRRDGQLVHERVERLDMAQTVSR